MGDTQESIFQEVGTAPPDPIFGVLARFKGDKSPQKVNLSIGGMKYRFYYAQHVIYHLKN